MNNNLTAASSYKKLPSLQGPANRNLNLMAAEMDALGYITPELWEMELDEERTQAAEILAVQEKGYAAIPRNFYPNNGDLVDRHGQSLAEVLDGGVKYMENQASLGLPGADWELKRRRAEQANGRLISDMPEGSMVVEISATPSDKPQAEREALGYNNLTFIRASIKPLGEEGRVRQYNYAIPLDSPDFLLAVQAKLGLEEQTIDSQKLLENPIQKNTDESAETSAREIDGLIGAALLEVSVGQSAVRMLSRAIENRREAWQFVNSTEHADLDHELFVAMNRASTLSPTQRAEAIKAIRTGYWKELKDRFNGRKFSQDQQKNAAGILYEAASRAVADGDVFIACGDSVKAQAFSTADRIDMMQKLRTEVKGNGACQGCGAKGLLYGCGLCSSCNKKWCDIYEGSDFKIQTDVKDLAHRNYTRPTEAKTTILDSALQALGSSWQKIKSENEVAQAA